MTFSYNGSHLTEIRVHSIHGRRGIGISQLWFSMEFHVPANVPKIVTVSGLRIRISISSEVGGEQQFLGIADPETTWQYDTKTESWTHRLVFQLSLSAGQLFEVENVRQGNGLVFHMMVYGIANGLHGAWPQQDILTFNVNISSWAKVLEDMGGDEYVTVGVPIPSAALCPALRPAIERVRRAHKALMTGNYDTVVSECRLAIESAQSSSGQKQEAESAFQSFMRLPEGEWRKMTKRQREQLIGQAARHYSHLAHHVDEDGDAEQFSREDALFILAICSGVVSSCARYLQLGE